MMINLLELLLYFVGFVLGVMLIIQMSIVYFKYKNVYFGLFTLSFIGTSLLALFYLMYDISSILALPFNNKIELYGEAIAFSIIIWSATMVILKIFYENTKPIVKIFVHILSVLPALLSCLSIAEVLNDIDIDNIYIRVILVLDCILFLRKYKKINHDSFRKLGIILVCVLSLYLIYLILQEIVPKFYIDLFPIFYLFWAVQLIIFSWKHFMRDSIDKAFSIKESYIEKYNITDREQEIIKLIQEGYTNSAISKQLFLSEKTVANHIYNIYRKLNITSRFELICLFKKYN